MQKTLVASSMLALTIGIVSWGLPSSARAEESPTKDKGTGKPYQAFDLSEKHGPAKGKGQGGGSGPGIGHNSGGRVFEMFRSIDTNGDGLISADEASARREKVYQSLAGNNQDKGLEAEKFLLPDKPSKKKGVKANHKNYQELSYVGLQARKKQVFKSMDGNGDGVVTKEEFMTAGKKRFEESDLDKDGYLTAWEFSQQHHRL